MKSRNHMIYKNKYIINKRSFNAIKFKENNLSIPRKLAFFLSLIMILLTK